MSFSFGAVAHAGFAAALQDWHEFYLLAGTAAVTLVGLLFVALSFHLDALLDPKRAHLLALARGAFGSYLYVLLLSLMFLVPDQSLRVFVAWTAVASLSFLLAAVFAGLRAQGESDPDGHGRSLARRRRMMIVLFAFGLIVSAVLAGSRDPEWLAGFTAVVILQLANAAWTSWDLLIEVGRMRRSQEARERS